MAGDDVRINNTVHSWDSVRLRIDGDPFYGPTSIEYGDGVEKAYAWGMGRHHAPRAITRGKYTPKPFVVTMPTKSSAILRQNLAAKAGTKGISNVAVPIVLQYIEDDATITVEAHDCRLTDIEASAEEGPDPTQEKVTFMPMRLLRNGIALYDTSEAGA